MLYYVSVCDGRDGKFLGALFVNAEGVSDARLVAGKKLNLPFHLHLMIGPVCASPQPIPAIGRLLTLDELRAHFGEEALEIAHVLTNQ